jgi:hypothetical protein
MDEKDRSASFVEFILRRAQQNSELTTNKQARRLLELIRTNPALALTSNKEIVRELAVKFSSNSTFC